MNWSIKRYLIILTKQVHRPLPFVSIKLSNLSCEALELDPWRILLLIIDKNGSLFLLRQASIFH